MVRTFSDDNWESETLDSPVLVLAEFWAPWCIPSQAMEVSVEEVARHHGEQLRAGRLNIDENPGVSQCYSIVGLPTLLLLDAGNVVARRVGMMVCDDLLELIAEVRPGWKA